MKVVRIVGIVGAVLVAFSVFWFLQWWTNEE
jgi:hypothetical protein